MAREVVGARAATSFRLLIVDDHELARAGLRAILAAERGLELVGEASDGREAIALSQRLRPDLVLMDVRMPGLDGLAATAAIKRLLPRTAVIMVTMHESPDYLFEALKAGAAGYVLKGSPAQEIKDAVRRVLRGDYLLNPALATQVLHRLAREATPVEGAASSLSARERDVLRHLARGLTNREIAGELVVSLSTVKTHVEHIIGKLEVSDRTQAAVRAIQLGLIEAQRA